MAGLRGVSDGKEQVYVQPIQATGTKWLISPEGGTMPRWRRDGRELFYRGPDGRLRAVAVAGENTALAGAAFEQGSIETLGVTVPVARNIQYFSYQPSADGRRFLVLVPLPADMKPTTVWLNWRAEARQ